MSERECAIKVGEAVLQLLNLEINKVGLIPTVWGDKTVEGLGFTIMGIVEINK